MKCFQRTCAGMLALLALVLPSRGGCAESGAASVVIETTANERFIGRVLQEDGDFVRFESATLGEVRIPRARIRSLSAAAATAGGVTAPPSPTQAAAAAVAPPSSPTPSATATPSKSALRERLNLPDAFTGSIAAGAIVKAGVLDQKSYTFSLTLGWQSPKNVFNSVFQYEYSKVGALVAADDFFFDNLLQHNLGEKSFLLAGGRYRADRIMAVDSELNLFVAPGRYLTKTPKLELGVAAGLSQLWQDYSALAPGLADPASTSDAGVAAYQFLQYRVLPRVQITQNNLFTHSVQTSGKFIYRFLLSANIGLSAHLSLVTQFVHGYDSEPAPGVDKSQEALTTQLSYQF